jgi:hypothetical protein
MKRTAVGAAPAGVGEALGVADAALDMGGVAVGAGLGVATTVSGAHAAISTTRDRRVPRTVWTVRLRSIDAD